MFTKKKLLTINKPEIFFLLIKCYLNPTDFDRDYFFKIYIVILKGSSSWPNFLFHNKLSTDNCFQGKKPVFKHHLHSNSFY